MFYKARLKLTAWYLIIILLISAFFSFAFYKASTREIERVIIRMEQRESDFRNHFNSGPPFDPQNKLSLDELQEIKKRLIMNLLMVNGVILLLSGGVAYLLSGKTLRPIKNMIDEQNKFISNSSHELRTPIATLQAEMEAGLLAKNITDKEARLLINSNLEEVDRLRKLSDELLEISRLESLPIKLEKISIQDVINDSEKDVKSIAKAKNITLEKEIGKYIVIGDKESLRELFVILLENAIKYSGKNSVVKIITIQLKKMVQVIIEDHGIGVPKEDIPFIFNRFYRADKSRSETKGFGLGLSIAKEIVDKNGAEITVESEEGIGSKFIVSIKHES